MTLLTQIRTQLNEHIELQPRVATLFNWGDIKPDLPAFERLITIKRGKRVSPDTQLEKIQQTRYSRTVEEGKARNIIENPIYHRDLTEDSSGVVRGIVASFDVASTHTGSKLLISVVKSILYDMPLISSKQIELSYRLRDRQAKYYLRAIKILLPILSKSGNTTEPIGGIKNPYESMI